MRKIGCLIAIALFTGTTLSFAEQQRTRFTKENRLPKLNQWETGVELSFIEYVDPNEFVRQDDANLVALSPYARYHVLQNLVLDVLVPLHSFEVDSGDNETGLGDPQVGIQMRLFQDIFDYPYVMAHINIDTGLGGEDLGPEEDESAYIAGITLGTEIWDRGFEWQRVNFAGDVSYEVNEDSQNSFIFSVSAIMDMNDQFSWGLESQVREQGRSLNNEVENADEEVLIHGLLTYKATDNLEFATYVGGGADSLTDSYIILKTSYTY